MSDLVRVFSTFVSIQGESTRAGLPCGFVRLAGCPLRCSYCDTAHVREAQGEEREVSDIVNICVAQGLSLVEVTGGEPLAQPGAKTLLAALADAGLEVLLETSGAYPIWDIDPRVRVIMDIKTPGSGMEGRFCEANLSHLRRDRHEVKFVVTGRSDFEWAVALGRAKKLFGRCEVLVSPARETVSFGDLAAWILDSRLPLRFQAQLHKLIWPEVATLEER